MWKKFKRCNQRPLLLISLNECYIKRFTSVISVHKQFRQTPAFWIFLHRMLLNSTNKRKFYLCIPNPPMPNNHQTVRTFLLYLWWFSLKKSHLRKFVRCGVGCVPDSKPYHLIIASAYGSWSYKLTKLYINSIETMSASIIGISNYIAAGGREGICPESAIVKLDRRGREGALGPQIRRIVDCLDGFWAIQRAFLP